MRKRIALTGATGFAGGPIVAALLKAGSDVRALVRSPRAGQFADDVHIVQGDLENNAALLDLVYGANTVVHVAGAISALNEVDYFRVNLGGTRNVFEAAIASGVRRFVYVSSITARLPEISAYAASKRAAEDFLQNTKADIEVVILRPSAIYGPGDKATLPLLAALQKRVAVLPGKASARFSLVHVSDFAAVVADAAQGSAKGVFEIDDMSGGHDWAELATISEKLNGLPQHVRYLPKGLVSLVAFGAEIGSYLKGQAGMVNRGKVRELYHDDWVVRGANWPRENPIGLHEGLGETLHWYQSNGWLPEPKRNVRRAA
jgi:nucleoside-diphosphate-sugar epimerase